MFARRWIGALLVMGALCVALVIDGGRHVSRASVATAAAGCARTAALAYDASNIQGAKGMVWYAGAGGADPRRLLPAATPVISPNGSDIAVTDGGHSAGLAVYNLCSQLVGRYFGAGEQITGLAWSPDSELLAAIVAPDPNAHFFRQHLDVIDIATAHITTVATGLLAGLGTPSFSASTTPYQLAYALVPHVDADTNIWTASIGGTSTQLTKAGDNQDPVWGPQGILYSHQQGNHRQQLWVASGPQPGPAHKLMNLNGWPVAVSSHGKHLAAEGAACGVVWPLSVNLVRNKVIHQFANGFAPFGISSAGGQLLIAGSVPGDNCGGTRNVIESVPFGGGRPTKIADGTSPSWAVDVDAKSGGS